jgi:hypothetical protein
MTTPTFSSNKYDGQTRGVDHDSGPSEALSTEIKRLEGLNEATEKGWVGCSEATKVLMK